VEDHERHHIPAERAWHGLIGGDDPLDGLGEGRQLACLNETKELLAGDVGAPHDGEVSGKLETGVAAVMWMQKSSELKGKVRERRSERKAKSLLTDKRRIPLRSASVRTPHLFHHGIPKVLVNPQSKGITSVRSTTAY
jgi:hypothetical protein